MKFNADYFSTAYQCASREETRYYLNGVYIAPHRAGALMVATDGHLMAIFYDPGSDITADEEPVIFSIGQGPAVFLRELIGGSHDDDILAREDKKTLEIVHDGRTGTLTYRGFQFPGSVIDGQFPDWRKVVPSTKGRQPAGCPSLDARRLADFLPPGLGHRLRIYPGKEDEAIVVRTGDPNFYGVLMPLAKESGLETPPEWLFPAES